MKRLTYAEKLVPRRTVDYADVGDRITEARQRGMQIQRTLLRA